MESAGWGGRGQASSALLKTLFHLNMSPIEISIRTSTEGSVGLGQFCESLASSYSGRHPQGTQAGLLFSLLWKALGSWDSTLIHRAANHMHHSHPLCSSVSLSQTVFPQLPCKKMWPSFSQLNENRSALGHF